MAIWREGERAVQFLAVKGTLGRSPREAYGPSQILCRKMQSMLAMKKQMKACPAAFGAIGK